MNFTVMHDSATKRRSIRFLPGDVRTRGECRTGHEGSETMRSVKDSDSGLTRRTLRSVAAVVALGTFAGAVTALAQPAQLQVTQPTGAAHAASVPYSVGEELTYRATFGGIKAGTARMRVDGIEIVRGRPAYHVVFSVDGGIPFFRVHDRYESWIDVETLSSLRHTQRISEGRYHRTTMYEIYPDRAAYQKN